jgi:hypothetical protein
MTENIVTMISTGLMTGRVTYRKRWVVVAAGDDAAVHEQPVHHAEGRVEDPHPGDGGERGGHDERQQQERPREVLAAEALVHHQGHAEPADQLQDRGHRHVEERVARDLPEHGVVGQRDEVGQAHEDAGAGDTPILKTQEDAVEERIGDEREQEEHPRAQHEPREEPFPLEQAA